MENLFIDLFDSMLFANRIERMPSSRGKIEERMLDLDVARVLYRACVIELYHYHRCSGIENMSRGKFIHRIDLFHSIATVIYKSKGRHL